MVQRSDSASRMMQRILATRSIEDLRNRLAPRFGGVPKRPSRSREMDAAAIAERWALLDNQAARGELADPDSVARAPLWQRNIENFVGTVKLPVGIAGPLRMNGVFAHGDFRLPLATTEAALVASFDRGSAVITAAGGCSAAVIAEGVTRTPVFVFATLMAAGEFVQWVTAGLEEIRQAAEATTRHGKLQDLSFHLQGSSVYLVFSYTTGDAAGQNMVTIATEAACRFIRDHCPVKARWHFLDANMSGDKKASALSFHTVRGRSATAEVVVPREVVRRYLHTEVAAMVAFGQVTTLGGVMSGTIGSQAHFANGLTALFIATGQDAACVAEAAVGVTRLEETDDGDLYASVSLPNLPVGTVGGGTGLPSQRACLDLIGLPRTAPDGPYSARALAELCAGVCLAGELSIIGAFVAGHFGRAHQSYARG